MLLQLPPQLLLDRAPAITITICSDSILNTLRTLRDTIRIIKSIRIRTSTNSARNHTTRNSSINSINSSAVLLRTNFGSNVADLGILPRVRDRDRHISREEEEGSTMAVEVEAATGAVPAAVVEATVREDGTAEVGSSNIQVAEVWTSGMEVEGEEAAEVGEADMVIEASAVAATETFLLVVQFVYLFLAFIIGYDNRHMGLPHTHQPTLKQLVPLWIPCVRK
mmetsp:Transcript_15797/g.34211  ORF Transcript_15797/g.34211 Transcript_15797/m.34211 type:complete len:223 (+) Transcript_15797:719-1387(+)